MHVTVKLFAQFREAVGVGKMERDLAAGVTVNQLLDLLQAEYPKLGKTGKSFITSVNQKFVPLDTLLQEDDEIAIFPPVSGGSKAITCHACPIETFSQTPVQLKSQIPE